MRLDQNNLEAVNRLGQLLHHAARAAGDDSDRRRQAVAMLARVAFVDDRARLFHGWSTLFVARADGGANAVSRAVAEVE